MKTNDENILYQLKTVEKFLLEINEKLKGTSNNVYFKKNLS